MSECVFELRNPWKRRASHPDLEYYADLVVHTQKGDIVQEECCLAPTVRNLLETVMMDHEAENGANDHALLVGECGEPGCCGVDFGVLHRDGLIELSWADPEELEAAVARYAREHRGPIFPNTFSVPKITVEVPRETYVEAVFRLAAVYSRSREVDGARDEKARKLLEWSGARYPEALQAVLSKESRTDVLRFPVRGM